MEKKSVLKYKQRIRDDELPKLRQDIRTLQKMADFIERNINNVSEENVRQFEKDIARMEDDLMVLSIG